MPAIFGHIQLKQNATPEQIKELGRLIQPWMLETKADISLSTIMDLIDGERPAPLAVNILKDDQQRRSFKQLREGQQSTDDEETDSHTGALTEVSRKLGPLASLRTVFFIIDPCGTRETIVNSIDTHLGKCPAVGGVYVSEIDEVVFPESDVG